MLNLDWSQQRSEKVRPDRKGLEMVKDRKITNAAKVTLVATALTKSFKEKKVINVADLDL